MVPVVAQTPKLGVVAHPAGDTTTRTTIVTAGASGSIVTGLRCGFRQGIIAASAWVRRGGTDYLLLSGKITNIDAETLNDRRFINLFSSLFIALPSDHNGNSYMLLESGDELRVGVIADDIDQFPTYFEAVYADL